MLAARPLANYFENPLSTSHTSPSTFPEIDLQHFAHPLLLDMDFTFHLIFFFFLFLKNPLFMAINHVATNCSTLKISIFLSPIFSLPPSLTNTHTHTHTYLAEIDLQTPIHFSHPTLLEDKCWNICSNLRQL